MRVVVLDCETTIFQTGNPFSRRNKLCYVGLRVVSPDNDEYFDFDIEYSNKPYGHNLDRIKEIIESADLLVGFNLKFDLHWIKRYVNTTTFPRNLWDCQLGEFILSHQQLVYPSLSESLVRRSLGDKLDVVSTEYWDRGIDTPSIPDDILRQYLSIDVNKTYELYCAQESELTGNIRTLFELQCMDLLVLQEMEYNGMLFDVEESERLAAETSEYLLSLDVRLSKLSGSDIVNWNSSDHVSAVLYGGSIPVKVREKTYRTLKDGTIKEGERWGIQLHGCERRVEPLRGTETATEGVWSVGEPILKSLKSRGKGREIVCILLDRSRQAKLLSTYYEGIPKIIMEKDWTPGVIHGQFNQCVAATGRLSSSAPNLQNFASDIKGLFGSRWPC